MEAAAGSFVVVIQTLVLPGMLVVIININIVIIVLPGMLVLIINDIIVITTIVIINDFKSCLSSFVESRDTAVPRASGRQRNSRIRDLVIIISHLVVYIIITIHSVVYMIWQYGNVCS